MAGACWSWAFPSPCSFGLWLNNSSCVQTSEEQNVLCIGSRFLSSCRLSKGFFSVSPTKNLVELEEIKFAEVWASQMCQPDDQLPVEGLCSAWAPSNSSLKVQFFLFQYYSPSPPPRISTLKLFCLGLDVSGCLMCLCAHIDLSMGTHTRSEDNFYHIWGCVSWFSPLCTLT